MAALVGKLIGSGDLWGLEEKKLGGDGKLA